MRDDSKAWATLAYDLSQPFGNANLHRWLAANHQEHVVQFGVRLRGVTGQ